MSDLRLARRRFRRTPGFTLTAVLTLALGIGASSAIFSVVEAYVLRPLPYSDPGARVHVQAEQPGFGRAHLGLPRRNARSCARGGMYSPRSRSC